MVAKKTRKRRVPLGKPRARSRKKTTCVIESEEFKKKFIALNRSVNYQGHDLGPKVVLKISRIQDYSVKVKVILPTKRNPHPIKSKLPTLDVYSLVLYDRGNVSVRSFKLNEIDIILPCWELYKRGRYEGFSVAIDKVQKLSFFDRTKQMLYSLRHDY